jgi:RNAse (barnase) inhibitor barstar
MTTPPPPSALRVPAGGLATWPVASSEAELADLAIDLHRELVVVDTGTRWDKRAFLVACADAFTFPGYFGDNWDALADCLSDVTTDQRGGLLVVWRGWGGMARQYPDDFATAVSVLDEFTEQQRGWGVGVLVLLVGSGPATTLPTVA